MLEIRRSEERGIGKQPWLDARFTFSFGPYQDPAQVGFSDLMLLNDDLVKGGGGFATHDHQDVEVFSYVLAGSLAHKDSMGEGSTVGVGEVLVMSAGPGITHSEFNASANEAVWFLQIWMKPSFTGAEPRYDQRKFDDQQKRGRFVTILSPDGRNDSMWWNADATVYAGEFDAAERAVLPLRADRFAYVHVIRGSVSVNGNLLADGDGARVRDERQLAFADGQNAEVLVFDLRPRETPLDNAQVA